MTQLGCPKPNQLEELLQGVDLDSGNWDSVQSHLQNCLSCQETLADLTSADSTSVKWQKYWKNINHSSDFENQGKKGLPLPTDFDTHFRKSTDGILNSKFPNLSGYRVEREIGRGGMGVVFLAEQLSIGRKVAIKTIGNHENQSELVTRLQLEAESLGKISHPNVNSIYEFHVDSSELPCLIMQWVDGDDLSGVLAGLEPSVETLTDWFTQLASGLSAVHQAGVIHRDIKPTNILMKEVAHENETPGPSIRPILSDFGLAKQVVSNTKESTFFAGTVRFMSPEQLMNDGDWVKPTTDIYSMGVVMYRSFAGQFPYSSENPIRLLKQMEETEILPVSHYNKSFPKPLDQIILNCLGLNPNDRYQTAGQLLQDLKNFQAGEAVSVRKLPKSQLAKIPLAGFLSAVLLIGIGVGWFGFSSNFQKNMITENRAVTGSDQEEILERLRIAVDQAQKVDISDFTRWENARDLAQQIRYQFPSLKSNPELSKLESKVNQRYLESRLVSGLEQTFEKSVIQKLLDNEEEEAILASYQKVFKDFGVNQVDQEIRVFFSRISELEPSLNDRVFRCVYDYSLRKRCPSGEVFKTLALQLDPKRWRSGLIDAIQKSNSTKMDQFLQDSDGKWDAATTSLLLLLLNQQKSSVNEQFLDESKERYPSDYFVNLARAEFLLQRKQEKAAFESILLAMGKKDTAMLRQLAGKLLMNRKEFKKAILHFQRSKELDPNSAASGFCLLECYESIGDEKRSKEVRQYLQENFPGSLDPSQ